MKKLFTRVLVFILLLGLGYGIYYCWVSFPIISGYSAKNMASDVFVGGRTEATVKAEELGSFPLSLASCTIDYKDSTVTASVLGFARKKAIYRRGLGCTLINGITEKEVRNQAFQMPALSHPDMDSVLWPMGDKVTDTISTIDRVKLLAAIDAAFSEPINGKKIRTRAVVVVYKGQLVGEKYAPGYTRNSRMLSWSMAKSVTSALIGILVRERKLKVENLAPVPEWSAAADPRHAITLEDLLHQASGLQFEENYTKACNVTNMLYKEGDMAAYATSQPLQNKPGTVFNYTSGNINIVSRIIRGTVGEEQYHSFPARALFSKIGMYSAVFEPDASGTFVGSSYIYATAHDWARFGMLYYNKGRWNGEQILPENWVRKTVTPFEGDPEKHYGYLFWLNGFEKEHPSKRLYPEVPGDMYYAGGYGGQKIFIIPSKNLVVVRLGLNVMDENKLLKEIIAALPGEKR